MQASVNRCTQPIGSYGARPHLKRDPLGRSAMRRSLFLVALLLSTRWAIAGAQDYERHGGWFEFNLGAGLARFACDSCDYHRATATNSAQLAGLAVASAAASSIGRGCIVPSQTTTRPLSSRCSIFLSWRTPATKVAPFWNWAPVRRNTLSQGGLISSSPCPRPRTRSSAVGAMGCSSAWAGSFVPEAQRG